MTATAENMDVVLVDMSPSVGALNQCFLMGADYFVIPTSPDYYCNQAITSLARVIPKWNGSVGTFRSGALQYPFPLLPPKFCGIISQRYRPRSGSPASSFQQWINIIKKTVLDELIPVLNKESMAISAADFMKAKPGDSPYNLANIADFNSLIAQSQKFNVPVFALTDKQIEQKGKILKTMSESRDDFRKTFSSLASCVKDIAQI
jgi:chromosome partitioning protein